MSAQPNILDRAILQGEPGRWNSYSREREPNYETVQAVDFTLNQASAGADVGISVLADVLTIDGVIILPGRDIKLVARRIECVNNASISTSGPDGIPLGARAEDGRMPGSKGSDGNKGENGAAAGSILLVFDECEGELLISANGGRGAKGQDGGNGAVGSTGSAGTPSSEKDRPGNGEKGGVGGSGGSNGVGGDGGAAGKITIVPLSGTVANLKMMSRGGSAGPSGSVGAGRKGGAGGAPGNSHFYRRPSGGPHGDPGGESRWPEANHGPIGDIGSSGSLATTAPINGTDGVPSIASGSVQKAAAEMSITQLKMSLSNAFVKFANENVDDLASQLTWLVKMASEDGCCTSFYDMRAIRVGSQQVGRPTHEELSAVAAQCLTFLQRLRSGLDVFGHSANFVPSLSPSLLEETAQKRFEIAKAIQSAHDKYLTDLSNLTDAADNLESVLKTVATSVSDKEADAVRSENSANTIQDEIAQLSLTISELTERLQQADMEFQNAIRAKGGGCSISQMIEFVAGVVAICYGVYYGYVAIAEAFKTANAAEGRGIIKDLVFLVETFKKSGVLKDFKEMQDGFNKVQAALKTNDTKLVISLEAFEQQLKPFMEMPEAENYRTLMRQLVDVARAKNEKQMAFTQEILNIAKSRADSVALQGEADRIKTLVAATNNPTLSDCVGFLTTYLEYSKNDLVETLELHRRALVYATLVPIKPSYRTAIVEDLLVTQLKLQKHLIDAMEVRAGADQNFSASFVISKSQYPWIFDILQEGGAASFSIPLDHPDFNRGGLCFVTVYEVAISIPGIKTSKGEYTCRLTHQGNPILVDQQRNLMNFSHTKRASILSAELVDGNWKDTFVVTNNLRGDDENYSYLSPFAGWTLKFEDAIDLQVASEINFTFQGRSIPSDDETFHVNLRHALN
ncbi:collagen-like protein [Rhizobium sp. NZLR4b]|uniref:collagen-like protein n=1 Tax=Rhizobium sp. NZLR4b TaxID=2731102 RepID=UPI001C83109B|nr:collagen-like protein [Rhizobium sp. NZLR4b]MBX5164791.1 hypothetical protein [Rhizobium sp. NZLR4b]